MDNDFLQEVLDWIEYCNGPADSKWGKVRAANGHPEPYGVKYWEIDNETWHMGAETYAEWVNRFAPAMRKADPSIKLAACGSAGYGDGRQRPGLESRADRAVRGRDRLPEHPPLRETRTATPKAREPTSSSSARRAS